MMNEFEKLIDMIEEIKSKTKISIYGSNKTINKIPSDIVEYFNGTVKLIPSDIFSDGYLYIVKGSSSRQSKLFKLDSVIDKSKVRCEKSNNPYTVQWWER